MSDFPPTWTETIFSSITTDAIQRIPEADEQFTYIDIGSIDRNSKSIVAAQRLLGADAPSRARKQVRSGDTLVSMTRPNLNAVALVPQELDGQIASTGFDVLRPVEGIDPRWISYLVRTDAFVKAMSDLVQGALYPAVRSKEVRSYRVPLAPSAEQTRIADQLDKLLARIQSCNDRLDAIPALLKRFRQAVLAAIKGDLIEGGASSGWRRCTIGDVLEGKPRNGYSPKAVVFETPVRSLTLSATTSGRFLAQHSKFIDEKIPDSSHLWLESGDILIQRANTLEYVGVSAIFDGPAKQFIYPDLMMKCRPNQQVLRKYLFFTLSAEETRQYFRDQATGTSGNMPKINQQTVMSAPIVLPSLEEQERIVKKVDALFHFADRIEARYTAARTQAQRLTTLLLAKAFRGELVPQDHNDEPASELLPRIVTTGITKASSRKKNQKKKVELMNNKAIVPIIDALRAANSPLTATELLVEAGYPADASTELIEKFFLDIRNELDNCRIERVRRGVDDVFSLVG
jgi:type I restriction enzyme S subunit